MQIETDVLRTIANKRESENLEEELSSKESLVAIERLTKAISLLEETETLLEASGLAGSLNKKIAVLKDELEVLRSHEQSPPMAEENDEDPFEIADPDAPTWSLRSNRENDSDFDDTDEEYDLEPEVNVSAVSAKSRPPKQAITLSTDPIQYAPVLPPLVGTMSLCGVHIKWQGSEIKGSASYMCQQVAKKFRELTDGGFQLNVTAKVVSVGYEKSKKNLHNAEAYAKKVVNGGNKAKYDRYAMIGGILPNHAAGDDLHLSTTLITTAEHELSHTLKKPNNLQHSSIYVKERNKWTLQSSRDGLSILSIFPAYGFAGPQQWKICMPENKVAQYNIGASVMYNIEVLYRPKYSDGFLRGVYIPNPTGGSDMFLSLVEKKKEMLFALHYFQKDTGGSQRVGLFKEKFQFNGLHDELNPGLLINREEFSGELAKISMKPAFLAT